MIKSNIRSKYNHQYNAIESFADDVFVADYSEQTKLLPVKRDVELFSSVPPQDINSFYIKNSSGISTDAIKFNNLSFVYSNSNPKKQCEAVFFPSVSIANSWILFCELKYSTVPRNNRRNLRKAILQLYKTRYYYIQEGIISITNKSYLIASLPQQSEPFPHFSLTPTYLLSLQRTRNIILRFQNEVEIVDDRVISV